jgi:hypothetical protein
VKSSREAGGRVPPTSPWHTSEEHRIEERTARSRFLHMHAGLFDSSSSPRDISSLKRLPSDKLENPMLGYRSSALVIQQPIGAVATKRSPFGLLAVGLMDAG